MLEPPENYQEPRGYSVYEGLRVAEQKKTVNTIMEMRLKREQDALEKHQHLTKHQWAQIEALWMAGDVTIKELVARFGKHPDTFVAHFRKYGIKKGSRNAEIKKAAEEATKAKARDDALILSERIKRTKEDHYKMSEAIGKLVFNEVLKAKQNGKEFRSIQSDVRALLTAAEALKKVREERWVTLGLDKDAVDEDTLPELVMSTMTPEQVEALRNAQKEDEAEMGLNDEDLNF